MSPPNTNLRFLEKHAVWPSGKKLIIYHANWSCYGRNFQVKDIPIDYISDLNYAFWDLRDDPTHPGLLVPTTPDAWADVDKRYTEAKDAVTPLDSWDESNPKPYYGNFGQFLNLKQHHGKLFNLGLSVGGWTMSKRFSDAVLTAQARSRFVQSLISTFDKYPGIFTRVDIDWEYIGGFGEEGNISRPEDGHNFVEFLKELRGALNATGRSHWEISTCTTADPEKMKALPVEAMTPFLDTINIMTYDFASSSWGPTAAGHHTNLHPSHHSKLSVVRAVDAFLARGVPASKIVIGVAFYSRGFANTDGLGRPSSGVVPDKSWEDGVVDYKQLPVAGATEHWDPEACAGYSYDPHRRILNSYDTVESVRAKCRYVWDKGLKGIIVWESSGDHPITHPRSLTRVLYEGLSRDPRH
ncbi:glycoside hydrolase [Cladochytrium replicatum]|nr:glycoside hydrolase [Cladochytrium replicatum]